MTVMWRNSLNRLIGYLTALNLTYFWNFGSLAMLALGLQVITGILLAMWYVPHVELAFSSIDFVMREVWGGWIIRYMHLNGASFFFFVLYCHILRSLYYGTYAGSRAHVWYSGIGILALSMAAAFFGYVLPWASMSFWAATVITSLLTTVPVIGDSLVTFVWGGYGIAQPTLTRIYCLHFLIPLVIVTLVIVHIYLLHGTGSSDPLGEPRSYIQVSFHPYYTVKDILGYLVYFIVFLYFVFYLPNALNHPLNYVLADPLITPPHIVPEWYFLPFYAILRSIPSKGLGVLAFALSFIFLAILPLISPNIFVRSANERLLYRIVVWLFVCDVIFLGWLAAHPAEAPYVEYSQYATGLYFFCFFFMFIIGYIERFFYKRIYVRTSSS